MLTDFHIAYSNGTTVVVDAPAILLDAVDTLGISADIIDVHGQNGVVGIDVDVVYIVSGTLEPVTVDALDEAFTSRAFLLEVYLPMVLIFRIDNHCVILLRVSAANEGNAKLIPVVRSLYSE